MTAKRKPSRPMKLLRALMEAQREAATVPASTKKATRDGTKIEESTYAGSEDAITTAREVLHRHDLMATVLGTSIKAGEDKGRPIMTIEVVVLHVESGQEQTRTFDVEVSPQYGSNAAATSAFATALRLILCLPREPERVEVSMEPQPPPRGDEPRETTVVRYPGPPPALARQVQQEGRYRDLASACQRLGEDLLPLWPDTGPPVWREKAGLPTEGRLGLQQLEAYHDFLVREVQDRSPPEDSGQAWASLGKGDVLELRDIDTEEQEEPTPTDQ